MESDCTSNLDRKMIDVSNLSDFIRTLGPTHDIVVAIHNLVDSSCIIYLDETNMVNPKNP